MAVNILDVTENYSKKTKLTQAQLNETMTSIETWAADANDNLNQLVLDMWGSGSGYDLGNDATAHWTAMNLWDKQSAGAVHNTADMVITTTGAWTDVHASQTDVSINLELTGDVLIMYSFTVAFRANLAAPTTSEFEYYFRVYNTTDSTAGTNIVRCRQYFSSDLANTTIEIPITIIERKADLGTGSKTYRLQYYAQTVTNAAANYPAIISNNSDVAGAASAVYKIIEKI